LYDHAEGGISSKSGVLAEVKRDMREFYYHYGSKDGSNQPVTFKKEF
jgi:hypothetical protein